MRKDDFDLRRLLAQLLNRAAELEHGLSLQYLYAAFSLKSKPSEGGVTLVDLEYVRGWKRDLYRVAREEMLHLGLVCNLLASIGYPSHFARPSFPLAAAFYPMGVACALEAFSLDTMARFIAFEAPKGTLARTSSGQAQSIGELYDEIATLLRMAEGESLFVGDPAHQVSERQITDPTHEFDDEVRTGYGVEPFVVTDVESALHAVDLIIRQGEGASEADGDTHYEAFNAIREECIARSNAASAAGRPFVPAHPVIANPICERRADTAGATLITHPATLEVAKLFNLAYTTMVMMLMRFYARIDDSHEELFRLQQIAFFPLMTMVIRPVGEILAQIPAFEGDDLRRAGAPFELPNALALLPHKKQAYAIFREALRTMATHATSLRYLTGDPPLPSHVRERLEIVRDDIVRLAFNFDDVLMQGGG